MDPEIVTVDPAAVKIARAKNLLGRATPVFSFQTERNIPSAYERPGTWPATRNIGSLPSAMGIVQGPRRTVHPQTQQGSSWNFPPFTGLWPQGVISQILSQRPTPLLDRLTRR